MDACRIYFGDEIMEFRYFYVIKIRERKDLGMILRAWG